MRLILRFDDICPTMNHSIWREISEFLLCEDIKPIIAVIPNNIDPKLVVDDIDENFWSKIRYYQESGWTIALHGNNHSLSPCLGSEIFFAKLTEFTSLNLEEQDLKIKEGIRSFASNGVQTNMFVAPAHSFNKDTKLALQKNNIQYLSDGLYLYPFTEKAFNLICLPQQLWSFRRPAFGVWTICCHHNSWDDQKIQEFKNFVQKNKKYFGKAEEISLRWPMFKHLINCVFHTVYRAIFQYRSK